MPSPHSPVSRRSGFTLVELVVVVLVTLVILYRVLAPRITCKPQGGVQYSLLQQGSQLAKSLLATQLTTPDRADIYPMPPGKNSTNHFASSTEYFRHLIRDEVITGYDFSQFGGAGVRPVKTSEPDQFTPEHNAWSVVEDAPSVAHDQTPFLISRNLVLPEGRLPDGTLEEGGADLYNLIQNTPDQLLRFSKTHLVVVTKSCSGNAVYKAKDLGPGFARKLNPTANRLPVLRP